MESSKFYIFNQFVFKHIRVFEMIGVLMRIFSFTIVSWLGAQSPFLFVWIINTADAILLSWCAVLKKDKAYSLLNIFWIGVGGVGILRAIGWL
jgi:hypothetical protein